MRTLVTGAAGHLGEALVRLLRDESADVTGTDIKPSPWCDVVGDLRDAGFVRRAVAGHSHIIHAATLHKPHIATHAKQDFVDVNVSGTLNLLEAALESGVEAFVFSSTTSVFGEAMRLPEDAGEALWVDETLAPVPKNIYGVTKRAAEDLCELFHRRHGLPAVILRASRFFPEQDDDLDRRSAFGDDNLKANELLFRRGDLEDMATAHLCAARRAPELGFGRFIVSATTPFRRTDLAALMSDAPSVVERCFPGFGERYAAAGWRMFPTIGRVYDNGAARRALGWRPRFDFARALDALARGEPIGSDIARAVGKKGYHDTVFSEGPYPVESSAQSPRGDVVG